MRSPSFLFSFGVGQHFFCYLELASTFYYVYPLSEMQRLEFLEGKDILMTDKYLRIVGSIRKQTVSRAGGDCELNLLKSTSDSSQQFCVK